MCVNADTIIMVLLNMDTYSTQVQDTLVQIYVCNKNKITLNINTESINYSVDINTFSEQTMEKKVFSLRGAGNKDKDEKVETMFH